MPKSKYPDKLDTSIEIPAVRDNIIEVGSDVLNSIRSALFQIERTLGINPQGAVGNTVSDRLNKALDGNGNILKEALDRSNVLSGPIVDGDVSKTAAINESKLRLDYPTQLLQDEVSQLIHQVDSMLATIEELSVLFNAHVHLSATNRHKGQAITIEDIASTTSSTGIISLEQTSSQGAFESIFQSHINYDGSDISLANRSHEADQLYFDNTDVSAYVDSEDVQGAIEEILEHATGQLDDHQNRQHDNGVNRSAVLVSSTEDEEGLLILDDEDISYTATTTGNTDESVVVSFANLPATPDIDIKKSDILKITDSTGSYEYQIDKATYIDETLASVNVFARFVESSESGTVAKIYRNKNRESNLGGLLVTVREYESITDSSYTNADILQIANPDAAAIITSGIRPSEITLQSNRYFDITVDEGDAVELDVHDGEVTVQTIDTILKKLNEQFAENALSVSAYRVDYDENKASEIALVHSIPSNAATSYTLQVSRGSDDGLDSMGLGGFEDSVVDAGLGTTYYIQGKAYNDLSTKLAETGLSLLTGTSTITSTSVDFEEQGVCNGDILVIAGSASDDGTYVILDVDSDQITVDSGQLSASQWAGESDDETLFYIYYNSISLNGLSFDISSDDGSGTDQVYITDIFMDYDRNVFYNIRLIYGALSTYDTVSNIVAITDFSGDISVYTEDSPGQLVFETSSDDSVLMSLDGGEPIELGSLANSYIEVVSGAYDIRLMLFIEDASYMFTPGGDSGDDSGYLSTTNPAIISIIGLDGINEEENMLLARVHYESSSSRVTGAGEAFPRVFSKLRRGTTSQKDLGSDAIFSNQQRPLKETRSNGVVLGLEVTAATGHSALMHGAVLESINGNGHYVINLSGGVCYVKGKRFELDAKTDLITGILSPVETDIGVSDKFFVAINQWGEIVFASPSSEAEDGACVSPFDPYDYCVLCTVEYNGSSTVAGDPPVASDLRLFIDQLDLKLLNSITVSPQRGMGHFTSINKALKYAKRFSEAYSSAGVPTVHLKSGVHKVTVDFDLDDTDDVTIPWSFEKMHEQGIYINFPVNIVGEGDSTVLDLSKTFGEDATLSGTEVDWDDYPKVDSTWKHGYMAIVGPGVSSDEGGALEGVFDKDVLNNGFVKLSNFKIRLAYLMIFDPVINDPSVDPEDTQVPLNWGINIDNVTFDYSEYTGIPNMVGAPGDTDCVLLTTADADGDSTADGVLMGNVTISNCQFLNSAIEIQFDSPLAKNISILNNTFRGGADRYAINCKSLPHIFDFSGAPEENNIQIIGNILADRDITGALPAALDSNGLHPWADRINGKLSLTELTFSGDMILEGDDVEITAEGYMRLSAIEEIDLAAEGEITISSDTEITISSDTDVNIVADNAVTITVDGSGDNTISLAAPGEISIGNEGQLLICSAGSLEETQAWQERPDLASILGVTATTTLGFVHATNHAWVQGRFVASENAWFESDLHIVGNLTVDGTSIGNLDYETEIGVEDEGDERRLVITKNVGTTSGGGGLQILSENLTANDSAVLTAPYAKLGSLGSHVLTIISTGATNATSAVRGTEVGLAFKSGTVNDFENMPGASITHERTGSYSKGKLHFKIKKDSDEDTTQTIAMTIDDTGYIGIGTEDPAELLTIVGDGDVVLKIKTSDADADVLIKGYSGTTTEFTMGYNDAEDCVSICSGSLSTESINISGTGYVGINVAGTDIDKRLHVLGDDNTGTIRIEEVDNGPGGPDLELVKKRDEPGGMHPQTYEEDYLGNLRMYGSSADHQLLPAARISCQQINGSTGSARIAGVLELLTYNESYVTGGDVTYTSADMRLSITQWGHVCIGPGIHSGSEHVSQWYPYLPYNSSTGYYGCLDAPLNIRCADTQSGGADGSGGAGQGGIRLIEDDNYSNWWDIYFGTSQNYLNFRYHGYGSSQNGNGGYLDDGENEDNIDFTGQHRLVFKDLTYTLEDIDIIKGLIVVSTGVYDNLGFDDNEKDTMPQINEALPIVSLSSKRNEKTVMGIISDAEDDNGDGKRHYKVGCWGSVYNKKTEDDNRLHINSLGEGAIWVSNINGDLENGDYITSCEIPGYGMKQDDDLLHNYTVAKITCDCNFDLDSNIYECVEFEFNGETYKKAFVGCTYHCG